MRYSFDKEGTQRIVDVVRRVEQTTGTAFHFAKSRRGGGFQGFGAGAIIRLCKSIDDILPGTIDNIVELWEQNNPPSNTDNTLSDVHFTWMTQGGLISGQPSGQPGTGKMLFVAEYCDGFRTIIGAECEDPPGSSQPGDP